MSGHGCVHRFTTPFTGKCATQGNFGRLFPTLLPARFGATDADSEKNLTGLADAMKGGDDPARDGNDSEESGLPALYTYFGQFVDHDLTFDPLSSLVVHNNVKTLKNFRTPAFDLDNVYGRGPTDQPYMYDDDGSFLLGDPLTGGTEGSRDLPRASNSRAIIGDPRNDENKIVSQLHGLFLRFHNRLIKEGNSFEDAKKLLKFHYQYLLLNDFLARVVSDEVLNDLQGRNGLYDRSRIRFFNLDKDAFIPVEFSGACYRFGHSMVRPGYRLNDCDNTLLDIFAKVPDTSMPGKLPSLVGNERIPPGFGIDWGRFIDIDERSYGSFPLATPPTSADKRRLQLAYRIDTSIVEPLSNLPVTIAGDPPASLAERNLRRGFRLGLPSGQEVARAMGLKPLDDSEILIGLAADKPDSPLPSIVDQSLANEHNYDANEFAGNCPLWVYILAEAIQNKVPETVRATDVPGGEVNTFKLGSVGGRVVAEVILGLMFRDKTSFLNLEPNWVPQIGHDYKLRDFVNFAIGREQ